MKRRIQILFIGTIVALSLRFFDATFINPTLVNYASYLGILGTIVLSVPYFLSARGEFVLPVRLIFFSIAMSMVMAYLSWGQGLKDTIIQTLPYMVWVIFFFLIRIKIPVRKIEGIILVYGVAYVVLYFFQLSQSPTVLFGKSLWGDEFIMDRGVVRIIFPGAGMFILCVLMAINKLTTQQEGRRIWIPLTILGLVIPVLQVTRQFLAGMSLLYLFHLLRYQDIIKKMGTVVAFVAAILIVINLNIPAVNGIIQAAERDANLGGDYIRVLSGLYFLTSFSPNALAQVLGNGAPYYGLSSYGVFVETLGMNRGYFLSDVGIIAVYAMFGILAVVGYIILWIKSFLLPLPKEYQYVRYYLWYLLFTSLTWYTVYHHHYIMSTVFALYIYNTVLNRTFLLKDESGQPFKAYVPYK